MLPYFDNQKILKEESKLTLENIYEFLEYLGDQEISFAKKAIYCKFGDDNEITQHSFHRFFTVGKLIRDRFLLADMKNYICKSKELKEYMKSIEMEKGQRLRGLSREYNTIYIFKEEGFSYFMSLVDVGDDFDMQISTVPFFIEQLLSFMSNYRDIPAIDEHMVSDNLYLDIDGYLGGKRNSSQEITLRYKLSNYTENKRNIFSILESLQEKGHLRIRDIVIKDLYISFILDSFIDFSRELFIGNSDIKTESLEIALISQNDYKFIIHHKSYELSYGETTYKFRKDSMLSKILQLSFEREINEPIGYDEFRETYGDIVKNQKEQSKELSTAISSSNKIFQEKFGIKYFFGRGKGYFYRQY